MKFTYRRKLQYTDVDANYRVILSGLAGMLQEAAILHSEHVGVGPRWLKEQGLAWILHKLAVQVERQPGHRDSLEIRTWARQMTGFKAHREFEVLVGKRIFRPAQLGLVVAPGRLRGAVTQSFRRQLQHSDFVHCRRHAK